MTDALLMQAKSGDAAATNELLAASQGYAACVVSGYLGTRFRSKFDVCDVVQNVLIEVARDIQASKAASWKEYLGWLAYVSRNCCYKQVEQITAKRRKVDAAAVVPEEFDAVGNEADPVDVLVANEMRQKLLEVASGRGQRTYRAAQMLIDGASMSDIAAELGLSIDIARGVVKRYRAALRVQLQSQ